MESVAIGDLTGHLEMMVPQFIEALRAEVEVAAAGVFGTLEQPICRFAHGGHYDDGLLRKCEFTIPAKRAIPSPDSTEVPPNFMTIIERMILSRPEGQGDRSGKRVQ